MFKKSFSVLFWRYSLVSAVLPSLRLDYRQRQKPQSAMVAGELETVRSSAVIAKARESRERSNARSAEEPVGNVVPTVRVRDRSNH